SESSHRLDSGSPFWRIQLDQDLLDTISAIYPEWFKVNFLSCLLFADLSRTSISSIISSSPTHQSNDESIDRDKASDSTDQEGQGHKSAKEAKTKSKVRKLERSKDRREKRQIREVDRDLPGSETVKKGAKHPSSGPRHERERTESSSTGRKSAGGASEDTSPESEDSAEMAEGNRSSPPKAEVDDSPLQYAMDRNKE
ncbi:GSCOCG00000721001-RA-CDS, partial [Cotesia congregata]